MLLLHRTSSALLNSVDDGLWILWRVCQFYCSTALRTSNSYWTLAQHSHRPIILILILSAIHISQVHSSSEGQLQQPLPQPLLPLYMECPSPLHYPVKRSMVLEASKTSPCLLIRRHPSAFAVGYIPLQLTYPSAAKQTPFPRGTCPPNCRWSLLA